MATPSPHCGSGGSPDGGRYAATSIESLETQCVYALTMGHIHPHHHSSQREIDPHFAAVLAGHVLRRMIATVRASQHGGTVIVVLRHRARELASDGRHMRMKYAFIDEEPRQRIGSLVSTIVRELSGFERSGMPLGWDAYESGATGQLGELDEALFELAQVARALDVEGAEREWVRTDRVGTRHRSAYRLCEALRDALALVVSQDGGLRFVRWHVDGVTY